MAGAEQASGQRAEANARIRQAWRTRTFDADLQRQILSRFGESLRQDDHIQRAQILLYGPQSNAARDIIPLLPEDQQALARARLALRQG
ncbi:MAG: hypothetical protein WCG92_23890, partial [Hyphomicrobiales bacterium]